MRRFPSRRSSTAPYRARPGGGSRAATAALIGFLVFASGLAAAEGAQRRQAWAITSATVITEPGVSIDNATVVVRDGLIEAVGADVAAPADARLIDGSGMTVYAGWIDAASEVARREAEAAAASPAAARGGRGGSAQLQMLELGAPGVNERVHPEFIQADNLTNEDPRIDSFREAGFTAALVLPSDGIYRGQSVLVAMRPADPEEMVLADRVTQSVGFATGGFGRGYPSSSMGVIALIRQVLLDTQRQATWENSYVNDPTGMPRPQANPAYTALMSALAGDQRVVFDASNTRDAKRALKIAQEFGLAPIIKGNGNEYEMTEALADAGAAVIVPVDYPDKPAVGDDGDANLDISLEALRRWEDAPGNAAALERAGVTFMFTADGVEPGQFAANVRKAIDAGLSADAALAALTTTPAAMFGVDAILGTIEPGKIANLVVASGAPFAEHTEVRHVFVDGVHTAVNADAAARRGGGDTEGPADPRGTWAVTMGSGDFSMDMTWSIRGEPGAYSGSVDGEPFESVSLRGSELSVTMPSPMGGSFTVDVTIRGDTFSGGFSTQGYNLNVSGRRTSRPGGATIEHGERQ